jgi:hypothetical protein
MSSSLEIRRELVVTGDALGEGLVVGLAVGLVTGLAEAVALGEGLLTTHGSKKKFDRTE